MVDVWLSRGWSKLTSRLRAADLETLPDDPWWEDLSPA
jgi:hypothetical protein